MAKEYKVVCSGLLTIVVILCYVLALYYQRTYTVAFDTLGGSLYRAQEVKPDTILEKPADPVMEGYIFDGWTVRGTGEEYDFTKPVTESFTLVAKWKSVL